ncbi:MAG: hypothetical protein QOJ42_2578 [Acidobacteriaceae bacterium]|jgi:hypothetical protein|nr:hypothetical protein [Acidobacteriaceae bacterium]
MTGESHRRSVRRANGLVQTGVSGNVVSGTHKWFVCVRVFHPRRIEEPKTASNDCLMAFQLETAFGIESAVSELPNLPDEAALDYSISQFKKVFSLFQIEFSKEGSPK